MYTGNRLRHYPKRLAGDNFVLELVFYDVRPVVAIYMHTYYIKIGHGI